MESLTLLDFARQAGLVVLRAGDRLVVRGPKRLAALAGELLDRKAEVLGALQAQTAPVLTAETDIDAPGTPTQDAEADSVVAAETDPGVALALDVFRGARVVAFSQPAVWPPEGGWIPSSARTIEVYAAEMPTAACRCCRATAWFRAGDGWTCSTCHPVPARTDEGLSGPALQAEVFELTRTEGFPRLSLGGSPESRRGWPR
jgi:hypothetical protein